MFCFRRFFVNFFNFRFGIHYEKIDLKKIEQQKQRNGIESNKIHKKLNKKFPVTENNNKKCQKSSKMNKKKSKVKIHHSLYSPKPLAPLTVGVSSFL